MSFHLPSHWFPLLKTPQESNFSYIYLNATTPLESLLLVKSTHFYNNRVTQNTTRRSQIVWQTQYDNGGCSPTDPMLRSLWSHGHLIIPDLLSPLGVYRHINLNYDVHSGAGHFIESSAQLVLSAWSREKGRKSTPATVTSERRRRRCLGESARAPARCTETELSPGYGAADVNADR